MATAVATTFATHAVIPKTSVPIASVDKLMAVVTTDTVMQRANRLKSVDGRGGAMGRPQSAITTACIFRLQSGCRRWRFKVRTRA